jgi:hypothetical protein
MEANKDLLAIWVDESVQELKNALPAGLKASLRVNDLFTPTVEQAVDGPVVIFRVSAATAVPVEMTFRELLAAALVALNNERFAVDPDELGRAIQTPGASTIAARPSIGSISTMSIRPFRPALAGTEAMVTAPSLEQLPAPVARAHHLYQKGERSRPR